MKTVSFNEKKNKIYLLFTWNYAYQAARKKYWEWFAVNRQHFKLRTDKLSETINPILLPNHRNKIYQTRFNKS